VPSILVPGKSWYLHKLYGTSQKQQQIQQQPSPSGAAIAAQQHAQAAAAAAAAPPAGGRGAGSSGAEQASMFRYSTDMLAPSRRSAEPSRSGSRQEGGQAQAHCAPKAAGGACCSAILARP
jgi:hypothetical protein